MAAEIPALSESARRAVGGVSQALLEGYLGSRVTEIVELTQPWATRTKTHLVSADGGERVVVQSSTHRTSMARRLRIGPELAERAPWLPIPELLAGDVRAPVPFMVTRFVEGRSGSALLADNDQARLLGGRMGAMAREVGRVPVSGLRLPGQWSDARRLGVAALRWSGNAADLIDAESTSRLHAAFEQLPVVFAGAQPVFAHGDFVPMNVIVQDEEVVALLDLERARLAHPLFDAAWFRLIVRHHHPERWHAIGPSFMAAAGVGETPADTLALDLLAALQCLEMLERTPGSARADRSDWAARLSEVISLISPRRLPVG